MIPTQSGTHIGCIFIEPTLVIEVHRCKEQDGTRKEQGLAEWKKLTKLLHVHNVS
jgi:hypothetical protein